MVLPNSARPPGRGADRQRGPARLRRWPSSGRPARRGRRGRRCRRRGDRRPRPGAARSSRVTRLGMVLGEQAAVELLAASVVRLGGQQHPGAVGAGGPDGELELGAEVGVERGLAHVAPAAVVHPVHRLPAADHDQGHVRVVGRDRAAPQAWPVAAVTGDALRRADRSTGRARVRATPQPSIVRSRTSRAGCSGGPTPASRRSSRRTRRRPACVPVAGGGPGCRWALVAVVTGPGSAVAAAAGGCRPDRADARRCARRPGGPGRRWRSAATCTAVVTSTTAATAPTLASTADPRDEDATAGRRNRSWFRTGRSTST